MDRPESMTVTLSPEVAEEIRAAVEAGQYASASDAVRDVLQQWQQRRAAEEVESLRRLVAEADAEPEDLDIDSEVLLAELEALYGAADPAPRTVGGTASRE